MKRTKSLILGLGFVLLYITPLTFAQTNYPNRPVRLIVPYGTGGGSDILARQIGAKLQLLWGQGVAVENHAGASGNIGTELVVSAPANGYTLLLQNSTMLTSQAVNGKGSYDPKKDLTPIMLLGVTPIALFASPNSNIKNFKDLIERAKKEPGVLNFGSCGNGTPQHLAMEIVKQKTNTKMNNVSYKGCSPGLIDVLGGHIPLAILSANLGAPFVESGKLFGIGVSDSKRYKLLPNTPTFNELGLKPLEISNWYALMGPGNLPKEVIDRVYLDVKNILADPEVKINLSKAGVEPTEGDAVELSRLIAEEQIRYVNLVKSANITP
jgi:tripartite-type tricarboxylate transporter receptor subunit TctC